MGMKIDVSIGELVDKVTILAIKLEKFTNDDKKKNVKREHDILAVPMNELGIDVNSDYYNRLKEINLKLWDIEDRIRIKEKDGEFDEVFIELARSVYFSNDVRAEIKREINLAFGSELIEEKQYTDYQSK